MTARYSRKSLFEKLALQRQNVSLIEKEFIAEGREFVAHEADWISLYYDTGSKITSDNCLQRAYRAITTSGDLLWLVFTQGKTRGYHSESRCPFDAFAEANTAIERRRAVRENWDAVEALARRLRTGRDRFEVKIEDAVESPLCAMGVRYFLRRFGIRRVKRMPASILAWLMLIEPQMGFILHQSVVRQRGEAALITGVGGVAQRLRLEQGG